ncbi:MAG: hypothetical protein JOY56_12470, partial [Solirubrobacterales bacterium]|nr:hypothetical protein [Solirubrobacterales bacterium]
ASAPGVEVALADRDEGTGDLERSSREAVLDGERVELEVLRGIPAPGEQADGPAVIELPESTLLVPPGWSTEVDETGTIKMSRSQ